MNNYLEKKIAKKIIELSQYSVVFIEKEYRLMSPAGKYQTCLLTGAIIIHLLQSKNIFNQNNGINVKSIINLLEDDLQLLFAKFKNEYLNSERKIDKYGNEYLDKLNEIGNDVLVKAKTEFIKNSVEISISHFWSELDKYQNGFNRFNSGTGKAIMPEMIFINIYIYPFFLSLIPNSERPEISFLINKELKNIHTITDYDFMLVPAKLGSYLANLINEDTDFITSLISINKPLTNHNYNKTQKGCYIATLVYQDIDHPKVEYLRTFRDNRLDKTNFGKGFIKLYYKYSPKIVETIKPYILINKLIKAGLDILIFIIKRTDCSKSLPKRK